MPTPKQLFILITGLALPVVASAQIRVAMSDALKAATSKPQPEYSAVAKQMKVSGKVEVEVTVAENGNVETAKPLSGNPLLTNSAVNAVKRWKFTPFENNGQPTKAVTTLTFNFTNN